MDLARISWLLILVATAASTGVIGCSYRYTKEFHTRDKFPPDRSKSLAPCSLVDRFDSKFGQWVVQVSVTSVFESKTDSAVNSGSYDVSLYFRLPEDTCVWAADATGDLQYRRDEMFQHDTSDNVIEIDSVQVTFLPQESSMSLSVDPEPHRSFSLGTLQIPESVDSLDITVAATLKTARDETLMQELLKARLFRWEYRWNDWLPLD